MRMPAPDSADRLVSNVHGVLATMHPVRGPDPQPVVYAVTGGAVGDYVGVPVDRVKPKARTRLQREDNLEADPRATLLVEHWETQDWSQLWWVRAQLRFVPDPAPDVVEALSARLAAAVPQYADRPFHRVLVCQIVAVTGWSAADSQA